MRGDTVARERPRRNLVSKILRGFVEERAGLTEDSVRTKRRNESAAAFCVGSSGARTVNVVA